MEGERGRGERFLCKGVMNHSYCIFTDRTGDIFGAFPLHGTARYSTWYFF